MSDLIIHAWNNEIGLDIIESKLNPPKEVFKFKDRLLFLFTGRLRTKVGCIFVRINKKGELNFLSEILMARNKKKVKKK